MRKFILTLLVSVLFITLYACNSSLENSKESTTVEEQEFVVGMECAYAPYNWTTSSETATSYPISGTNLYCDGYDVKIAKLIADELNMTLVIKSLEWDGLILSLQVDEIDAIIAGMSPTLRRSLTIDFTDAYYRTGSGSEQVVVILKDGEFGDANSLTDFDGALIAAQLGTLQDEEGLIEQLVGSRHATPLSDYPTLVTALKSGTIDGFIAELPVAEQIVRSNSTLSYVSFTQGEGFVLTPAFTTTSIGLRKEDTELKNQINAILSTISEEDRVAWMNEFIDQ